MRALLAIIAVATLSGETMSLTDILSRVSEEAEIFQRVAPQTLTEETLSQRSLKPQPRFRPHIGTGATTPPKIEYFTREIVSEYSFAALRDTPGALHEFRQVISVDGRPVSTPERARHALSLGLQS